MDSNLTGIGVAHTFLSLIALFAGGVALFKHGRISFASGSGKLYLATLLMTCLTGFGIFRNGSFGPAHVLTVVSLLLLALGAVGDLARRPARGWRSLRDVSFSLGYFVTLFFTVTEAFTRLPLGQPLAVDQNAPIINVARLIALVATTLLITRQLRRNRLSQAD